jgi:hypothetical protein
VPGRKFWTSTSARGELAHDHCRFRPLEVKRQRALATVRGDEQRRELARRAHRLPAVAGDITAERLDLDHFGALIGEKHCRQWTRDDARQIEHRDSCQWTRHV